MGKIDSQFQPNKVFLKTASEVIKKLRIDNDYEFQKF